MRRAEADHRPSRLAWAEDGFTLVEVLAALAIFSIAAAGLVHINIENARTTRLIETRTLAHLVAENAMVESLLVRSQLQSDDIPGEVNLAGRIFKVERTIADTPNPAIIEIKIRVWCEAETSSSVIASQDGPTDAQLSAFRRRNP